jgi:chromosome segregation ATPase
MILKPRAPGQFAMPQLENQEEWDDALVGAHHLGRKSLYEGDGDEALRDTLAAVQQRIDRIAARLQLPPGSDDATIDAVLMAILERYQAMEERVKDVELELEALKTLLRELDGGRMMTKNEEDVLQLYTAELSDKAKRIAELEALDRELEEAAADRLAEVREKDLKIRRLEERLAIFDAGMRSEVDQAQRDAEEYIKNETSRLRAEEATFRERFAFSDATLVQERADAARLRSENKDLVAKLESQTREKGDLQLINRRMQSQIAEVEARLDGGGGPAADRQLSREIESLKLQLADNDAQLKTARATVARLQGQLSARQDNDAQLKEALATIERLQSQPSTLPDGGRQLEEARATIERLQGQLARTREAHEGAERRRERLGAELSTAIDRADRLEDQLEDYRRRYDPPRCYVRVVPGGALMGYGWQ